MASCQPLPDELWLIICAYCSARSLHTLTLTSRQLYAVAQSLLYRGCDASLSLTPFQCKTLVLTLAKRPDLAPLCRGLRFAHNDRLCARDGIEADLLQLSPRERAMINAARYTLFGDIVRTVDEHFNDEQRNHPIQQIVGQRTDVDEISAMLLCLCPNLHELDIPTKLVRPLFPWPKILLQNPLKGLKTIRIDGYIANELPDWVALHVLPPLRTLQTLEIHDCDIDGFLYTQGSFSQCDFKYLKTLGIYSSSIEPARLENLMDRIDGLESFAYEWVTQECAEDLMLAHGTLHFLRKHLHTLRRLKLALKQVPSGHRPIPPYPPFFNHFAEPTELVKCANLEYLEIEYLAFLDDETTNWDQVHAPEQLTAPLDEILPTSVKKLVLRCCLGQVRWHLRRLLKLKEPKAINKFPNLRNIHVEMWPNYSEESWVPLKDRFHAVGVDLEIKKRQQPMSRTDTDGSVQPEVCPYLDNDFDWQYLDVDLTERGFC